MVSHKRGMDEGLEPLQRYVCDFINQIIVEEFNAPDLEFVWQDGDEEDTGDAAKINVAYVQARILNVDEVRQSLRLAPLGKQPKYGKAHPAGSAFCLMRVITKPPAKATMCGKSFHIYLLTPGCYIGIPINFWVKINWNTYIKGEYPKAGILHSGYSSGSKNNCSGSSARLFQCWANNCSDSKASCCRYC